MNMAQSFPRLPSVPKRFSHITSKKRWIIRIHDWHYRYAEFSYVCLKIRKFESQLAAPHDAETVGLISDLATLIK